MRQVDIHVEVGDGVLDLAGAVFHLYRMQDVIDAYLIDSDSSGVLAVL